MREHASPPADRSDAGPESLVRVYVWELPVRLVHWTLVLTMALLAFTGWYLHEPFIGVGGQPAWVMAIMRQIHLITGFVFTTAFLVRIYWFFVGNRWSRWRAFVPLARRDWDGIGRMLSYYLFVRWRAPKAIGHNRLAAMAYLAIYIIVGIQVVTGFALYGWIGTQPWVLLFGWLPRLMEIQRIRELHYFIMFVFGAFMLHHVYSSLLVSTEEKNGLMGSIFSGHKFVLRRDLLAELDADSARSSAVHRDAAPSTHPAEGHP